MVSRQKDIEGATMPAKTPAMQAPRSRLLLSCGASAQAVARGACRRVEAMPCPVGCVARGLARAAAPVLGPLQRRCLAALAFADRQLSVAQDVAAVLLPPSERALRKVDQLVLLVESLPARLDCAMDDLEALVAGVKSSVLELVDPRRYCCRSAVFRDIRCECDEEEGAARRAAARAMEKRCEEVTRKVECLEVITVDGGDEYNAAAAAAADPAKTIGVGSTEHGDKTQRHAVQGAYKTTEEQEEAGREDAPTTPNGSERQGGATPATRRDVASGGGGARVEGLNHVGGGALLAAEGAKKARTAGITDAMQTHTQGAETAKAESPEGGSSSEREEAIPASCRGSKEDALLLHLFDEAWQQKMA